MKGLLRHEWRQYRLSVFLVLCLLFVTRILTASFFPYAVDKNYFTFLIGYLLFPLSFALVLGAIPFDRKLPRDSEFLVNVVSSWKIFCVKFLLGSFILLLLVLVAHIVFPVPSSFISSELGMKPSIFLFFYLPLVAIFAASLFASLFIKKALLAVLCTPFILSFGFLLILPLLAGLVAITRSVHSLVFAMVSLIVLLFALFSFLTWQKAVLKGISPLKIVILSFVITLATSFGIHALLNLLTGIQLSRAIGQAKAIGAPVTLSEIIPPPVAKEDNAALIFQEAFALLEKLEAEHQEEYKDMFHREKFYYSELVEKEDETITQLLLRNQDFLALYRLLEEAASLPACRFELKYEDGPSLPLPHLSKMRALARLVQGRTHILLREKRFTEALKSAQLGFRLGDGLNDEPIYISQLIRTSIDIMAMNSLQLILDTSEQEVSIHDFQELILEVENKKGLTKGLDGNFPLINGRILNKIVEGKVRIKKYETKGLLTGPGVIIDLKGKDEEVEVYIHPSVNFPVWLLWRGYVSYLGRPVVRSDCAFYLGFLTESVPLWRLPYYQARPHITKLKEARERHFSQMSYKYPFRDICLFSVDRALEQQAMYYARLGGLKIALALKIYKAKRGEYPDRLSNLSPDILPKLPKDPFTGKDYIYRKTDSGFIVYSVGKNLKDDGGIPRERKRLKDYDIVWTGEFQIETAQ